MFRKGLAASLISLSLIPVLVLPALAQDATPEATGDIAAPANTILGGLNNPRGISYDADGNLLIAEAGAGGAEVLMSSPDGDIKAGFSSQINKVDKDGKQSIALGGLFSVATPTGEVTGTAAAYLQDGSLWLALSGGGPAPNPQPLYGDGVAEVDSNGRIVTFIDTFSYELANNPDEAGVVDSNVNNLTWGPDGTLYIVDTGANDILSWTEEDGLDTFMVWKDDPVPTAIRFADDGSFYVGFLGQGLAPGAGKVEHWSADGKTLIETFGNLTTVTDIAIGADGSIYAVELLTQFGDQGPVPNSGAVVKVDASGTTIIAENLPQPYSLAQAPDGSWAVSVGSTFGPPGTGAVIKIG